MGRVSDLPLGVVQHIAHLARGRLIPGTNKYARVCRQWQDACSSEEAEQLQLLVDLHAMSAEEVARACSWFGMHGRTVQTLVVAAEGRAPPRQTWFTTAAAAAALGNLRRLEVDQGHSLLMLAPVLGLLPQLQHLGAAVAAVGDPHKGWVTADHKDMVEGVFKNRQWRPWKPLPDMKRLCPQLTHLRLRLDVEVLSYEHEGDYEGRLTVDKRLPRLLPPTLQHLTLSVGDGDMWREVLLPSNSLTHVRALQQLTLDGLELDSAGCQAVATRLTALQALRVLGGRYGATHDDPVLLLGPKVVEYHTPGGGLTLAAAPHLVHLTRLVYQLHGEYAGSAEAVTALTGLQDLSLVGSYIGNTPVAAVLRQAARLPQLRSLQLDGRVLFTGEIAASLAQCTQVTSLNLCVPLGWGDQFMHVPPGLTGLQRLTVPSELLQQEANVWLAPLTALTGLYVIMGSELLSDASYEDWSEARQQQQLGPRHQARAQEVLQVQVWPPGLRQVVWWVEEGQARQGVAPRHWQHTPSAPGSVPFDVFFEEGDHSGSSKVAPGWARPLCPCPHLPGVRELHEQVHGG
jgi:hypothetical protein